MSGRHGYSRSGLQQLRWRRTAALPRHVRVLRTVGVLSVIGLVLGATLTAFVVLPLWDRAHPVTVECDVSAAAVTSGGRYGGPHVLVSSPDCGTVSLSRGVTSDTAPDVVEDLEAWPRWRFTTGELSLRHRAVFDALGVHRTVDHPERVPPR